jgi:hypothetical protein
VDQGASVQTPKTDAAVNKATTARSQGGSPDGLADRVVAVETARERLGRDLERLNVEVRAQMGQSLERTLWKVFGTGLAIAAAVFTRRVITAAWKKAKHADPPANPAAWETTWAEALAWSAATGVAIGVARMVAARGAVAGWQRAFGRLPPDMQEVQ